MSSANFTRRIPPSYLPFLFMIGGESQMNISARPLTNTLMLLLLLLLMADRHTGNMAHEWLGVLLLTAILLHAWLNRTWFSTLRKGKYTLSRSIRLILNGLLFTFMAGTLASAIIISQTVFAFAGFKGELSFRTMHVFCAHWSFLLSAMHLGLYGKRFCNALGSQAPHLYSEKSRCLFFGLGAAVAAYGVHAFQQRELIYSLTMRSSFMPWSENAALFLLDYSTIFFLGVWIVSLLSFLASRWRKKQFSPFINGSHAFCTDTRKIRNTP